MRSPIFSCLLLVVNLALVCANMVLSSALSSAEARHVASAQKESAEALHALRKETAHLLAERTRFAMMARSNCSDQQLAAAISKAMKADEAEDPHSPSDEIQLKASNVPLFTEEEKRDLVNQRDRILVRPNETLLLQDNPDLVVGDPMWNPTARSLTSLELKELSHLIAAYRYYMRTSPVERNKRVIQPAIVKMAEFGAFIEYPAKEPEGLPPPVTSDGTVVYSVSDRSPTPGYRRLFYFYPSEYPEIYHEEAVEQERSLEAYVRIYELINGPVIDASSTTKEANR